MKVVRAEHPEVPAAGLHLEEEAGGFRLWTFAGGRANNLLAKVFEAELGEKVTSSNLYLRLKDGAGKSGAGIQQALAALRHAGRPNEADALKFASECARTRPSKFEPCLPERLVSTYMMDQVTDSTTAAAVVLGSAV